MPQLACLADLSVISSFAERRYPNIMALTWAELHGLVGGFGYEVGLFNGTGISVNTASKLSRRLAHTFFALCGGRLTDAPG